MWRPRNRHFTLVILERDSGLLNDPSSLPTRSGTFDFHAVLGVGNTGKK